MLIARQGGDHVVMVSREDFSAMQETLDLLSSPKNAGRIVRSVAQIDARRGTPRKLPKDEQTESPQQGGREVW